MPNKKKKQVNKDKSVKIIFQVGKWGSVFRIGDRNKLSPESLYFYYRDAVEKLEKHLIA